MARVFVYQRAESGFDGDEVSAGLREEGGGCG